MSRQAVKLQRPGDIQTLGDVLRWRLGEGEYSMVWALRCIDVLFEAINAARATDESKGGLWQRRYKPAP